MCGRFVVARASADLAAEFEVDQVTDEPIRESYNIAPTTSIPVVVDTTTDDGERVRRLEVAKWGLVPPWAKDESVAVRAFNARSETVTVKPTFRAAVKRRRAVIPADGYYEWRKHAAADGAKPDKQPFYIHPADGDLLRFAGLYEWWQRADGSWLLSATILTHDAPAGPLAELHDRAPVFLGRNDVAAWLDPDAVGDDALVERAVTSSEHLASQLQLDAVDRRVGNVREDDPELIAPLAK